MPFKRTYYLKLEQIKGNRENLNSRQRFCKVRFFAAFSFAGSHWQGVTRLWGKAHMATNEDPSGARDLRKHLVNVGARPYPGRDH